MCIAICESNSCLLKPTLNNWYISNIIINQVQWGFVTKIIPMPKECQENCRKSNIVSQRLWRTFSYFMDFFKMEITNSVCYYIAMHILHFDCESDLDSIKCSKCLSHNMFLRSDNKNLSLHAWALSIRKEKRVKS